MRVFSGFPAKMRVVRLPESFFTDLLPLIDDLDELKVILHVLYQLGEQQGPMRYVRHRDLLDDPTVLAGLDPDSGRVSGAAVEAALDRAVERGALLRAAADPDQGKTADGQAAEIVYFANTPKGRAGLEAVRRGEPLPEAQPVPRLDVFVLYEANIGPLTPLISEELGEAERTYPAEWIEDAFREAVSLNKRSWRYIRAILERWRSEGRKDETARRSRKGDRRRYVEGEYGEFIER